MENRDINLWHIDHFIEIVRFIREQEIDSLGYTSIEKDETIELFAYRLKDYLLHQQ